MSSARNRPRTEVSHPKSVRICWQIFFGLWLALLSGGFTAWLGSPGVLQLIRLTRLLESKRAVQTGPETQVEQLEADSTRLEQSRYGQEREIRKVLGYAAPDELIFDFNGRTVF